MRPLPGKFRTLAAPMRPCGGNSGRWRDRCVRCRGILDVGGADLSSVAGIQDAGGTDLSTVAGILDAGEGVLWEGERARPG
jgi:hypothetical protein